jgi:hypothetical protein
MLHTPGPIDANIRAFIVPLLCRGLRFCFDLLVQNGKSRRRRFVSIGPLRTWRAALELICIKDETVHQS